MRIFRSASTKSKSGMAHFFSQRVSTFFKKYTQTHYKRGEVILRAGDTPSGVYFLKRGYVRMYLLSPGGDVLMFHIFRPGAFFPMTWVVNDTPNTYYFDALGSVEIYRAPKEEFQQFLKKSPDVLEEFNRRILAGLTGVLRRMEMLLMDEAYPKTVKLILYFAEQFGETDGKDSVALPIKVTHKDIASWIGTTRETASIQMELLKKQQLILYQRRAILVPSLSALRKEINH